MIHLIRITAFLRRERRDHANQDEESKQRDGELYGVEEVESSSEAPPGISSCSDMFSCERSLRFAASPGVFNYRPNCTNYPPDVFSAGFRFLSGPFRTYRAPAAVYCTGLESRDALPALCQDAVDRDRAEPGCSKEDALALQSLRPVKITNFEVLQAVGPRPSRPALEQKKTIWKINFVEYEMGALLGRGRSGTEVLEAVRLEDGLQVAVKIVPWHTFYFLLLDHDVIVPKEVVLHLAVDQEPRFSEIIQLLDWDVTHMGCIMVLERPMHSQPLDEFIISYRGSFPEDLAQVIVRQVVTAAQVCCQRLVFHKDIKLENLLINPKTLKVKLIDFGSGEILMSGGYETFEGTMEYCPPEYLTVGRYCGEPATVWSLRILSYVMLRLKFPRNRQLKKLDEGTWRKRRLSMECHDFLHRCLQTEPSNRLQLDEVLLHPWFNDHSSHFYLDSDDSFSSDTSIEEIGHSRSFQMSWRTHTSWKTEQLVFFFTMLFLISLLTFIVILLLYFS